MDDGNIVMAESYAAREKLSDVNETGLTGGGTLLYRAARDGWMTIVKSLLAAEADMSKAD